MSDRVGRISSGWLKTGAALVFVVAVVRGWMHSPGTPAAATKSAQPEAPKVEAGQLFIPVETARSMQLRAEPVRSLSAPKQLRLTGQLILDPNRLVHVTSRFGGEVVRIANAESTNTPLRVGQHVEQGQLLAVLWSKDIGEKKSDLVDALSRLYLHQAIYDRLNKLGPSAVPGRTIEEMRQNYESDVIQVERVRRTLISWHLQESDLKAIEQEAQRIHADALAGPNAEPDGTVAHTPNPDWANTEIHSPIAGTILERNLTVGDIVEPDTDLFKVADLSQLIVLASIYEEDLPALLSLKPEDRKWQIRLNASDASEPLPGTIDLVGNVVDPNQHTAVVQGVIENSSGNLRVGQFVEAIVNLPANAAGVEVPLAAVIDDGARPKVLLSLSDDVTRFRMQPVTVLRRTTESAWIEAPSGTLAVGNGVLVSGGLELLDVWNQLAPEASESAPPQTTTTDRAPD